LLTHAGTTSTGGGRRASAASPATRTSTSAPSVRIHQRPSSSISFLLCIYLLICCIHYIYIHAHSSSFSSTIYMQSFHSIHARQLQCIHISFSYSRRTPLHACMHGMEEPWRSMETTAGGSCMHGSMVAGHGRWTDGRMHDAGQSRQRLSWAEGAARSPVCRHHASF
jgi:hypothetical protein